PAAPGPVSAFAVDSRPPWLSSPRALPASAQALGRGQVGSPIGAERHAKQGARLRRRVVAPADIAGDQLGSARRWLAVATTAGGQHFHAIADLQGDVLVLGQVLGNEGFAAAMDLDHVGAARAATANARRPEAAMIHDKGGTRLSTQQLNLVVHAEAAALL